MLALAGEQALFAEAMRVGEAFLGAAGRGAEEEAWAPLISAKWRALMFNPTSLEQCRRLALPTHVLWGGQSHVPERRVAEILASLVPGWRHEVLNGAGHMSPLTHPAEVSAAIRRQLDRVSAGVR